MLSRPEGADPEDAPTVRRIAEVYVKTGRFLELHVGGRTIRTTAEHPFYARGLGWTAAGELRPGDEMPGHTGGCTAVESVDDTEEYATVYNLNIEDDHTYFVGSLGRGFSLWAHNASSSADGKRSGCAGGSGSVSNAPKNAPKFSEHKWGDASKPPCFPSGTLVHTPTGTKPIQSFEDGDKVLAFDPETNSVVERTVVACLRNWTQHLVKIVTPEEAIVATRTHPFFDPATRKWMSAQNVQPGMSLLRKNLETQLVHSVEIVGTEESSYNIELEGLHNYFVGESGCLVHNSSFESTVKTQTEIYVVKDPSGKVVYV